MQICLTRTWLEATIIQSQSSSNQRDEFVAAARKQRSRHQRRGAKPVNDLIGTRHKLVTSSHKSEERLTSAPYRCLDAASYLYISGIVPGIYRNIAGTEKTRTRCVSLSFSSYKKLDTNTNIKVVHTKHTQGRHPRQQHYGINHVFSIRVLEIALGITNESTRF